MFSTRSAAPAIKARRVEAGRVGGGLAAGTRSGAVTSGPSAPRVASPPPPPPCEAELHCQRLTQAIAAIEAEKESARRKAQHVSESGQRLLADHEEALQRLAAARSRQREVNARELQDLRGILGTSTETLTAAQDALATRKATCAAASAALTETEETLAGIRESVATREALIEMEQHKQHEMASSLQAVEREIAALEAKKQSQMDRLDELKAFVERTRLEEAAAVEELEHRKVVITELQHNVDKLRKVRKCAS